jgi:bifunctional non-homologous end joining protein LigD
VITCFPDGIDGKSFYQKDAPESAPEWLRTVSIWSEDTQREIRYFVCDDEESLLHVANLGAIPLHIWASRVGSPRDEARRQGVSRLAPEPARADARRTI